MRTTKQHTLPILLSLLLAAPGFGQTAPTASTVTDPSEEEPLLLSPFEVSTSRDRGYLAANALAGGRTDTPLKLTPASVSVMTTQFLEDLAITNLEDAYQWALNVEKGQTAQSETANGFFQANIRGSGGGASFPTRNYFLYYGIGDSYNTERFEFARGPNSILFGDGQLGGVITTFTKIPRLHSSFQRVTTRYQAYETGGGLFRATVDVNTPLGDRAALRVNGVVESGQLWRDFNDREFKAFDIAGLYKLTDTTQLRVEAEWGDREYNQFANGYGDGVSYWDGVTVGRNGVTVNRVTGAVVPPGAAPGQRGPAGVGTISTTVRNTWIPALPEMGVLNMQGQFNSQGTQLDMLVGGRPGVPNSPVLPSREFTFTSIGNTTRNLFRALNVFLDQKITDDLHAQIALYDYTSNLDSPPRVMPATYSIDINEFLPNGQPNPKFGVPYAEAAPARHFNGNEVTEYRGLLTYRFEVPKFAGMKQRLSLIAGSRAERFRGYNETLLLTSGPGHNPNNINAVENRIFFRYYWDEPLRYGAELPQDPNRQFAYLNTGYNTIEEKTLDYVQLASNTTFLDDRVSMVLGARNDHLTQRQQVAVGGLNESRYPGQVVNGVPTRGVWGPENHTSAATYSAGAVVHPIRWLGLFANYSENFGPATAGPNKLDGTPFTAIRGEGVDYGVRLSLLDGMVYATLTRYESEQTDRIVSLGQNLTDLRNIWIGLNSSEPAQTEINFRDTEAIKAMGYEFEIVANPLPNLRLSAGLALPETEVVSVFPDLRRYYNENLPTWQATLAAGVADGSITSTQAANINAAIARIRQTVESSTEGTVLNRTFDHTWNFYGTYSFSGDKLKGWGFGAGANGRGRAKIGSADARVKFNTNTPTVEQLKEAAFDYQYAPAYYIVAAHVSYERKIGKVQARFQFNVSNLLDHDDPIWLTSVAYRPGLNSGPWIQGKDSFNYLQPRTYTFTASFSF